MMRRRSILLAGSLILSGCSIKETVRKNDDRYLLPNALDSPLNGVYSVYSFNFMRRYRLTYEWVSSSGCGIRSRRLSRAQGGRGPFLYEIPEIYEEDGKTWQGSNYGDPPMDLDRWVRSVKAISRVKGEEGRAVEVGLKTLCFEAWGGSSHYLMIRLHKGPLEDFQARMVAGSEAPIHWTRRTLNGMEWRVVKIPFEHLESRALNGAGALYEVWITLLGDTDYAIGFALGASKESLDHPRAHAAFEATFQHLLHSLKVEPLPP